MSKQISRTFILTTMLVVLVAAPLGLTRAEPEPDALGPTAINEHPDWETRQSLSIVDAAVKLPVVVGDPNSGNVWAAYSVRDAGSENTNDILYRASSNYGSSGTWTSAQPIHSSPGVDSVQVDLALDGAGSLHAMWIEGDQLVYAPQSSWPNPPTIVSDVAISSNPDLVINGNVFDVVWTEGPPMNVYHARSTNGGGTWTAPNLVYSSPSSSLFPTLVVDPANGNKLYVVWEEKGIRDVGSVYYSEGTVSGGISSWSNPIEISELGEANTDDGNDARPRIMWRGGARQVAYTHVSASGQDQQSIYYTECSANCTSRSSWAIQQNISGQVVGANAADPFNVQSTVTTLSACSFVYFPGTDSDFEQDNEVIWGVNSCDGWASVARDQVTDPAQGRSISPVLAAHPDGWLYMVYEQIVNKQRQTYFVRGMVQIDRGVYLPIIIRN